jgi:hypothetical protein
VGTEASPPFPGRHGRGCQPHSSVAEEAILANVGGVLGEGFLEFRLVAPEQALEDSVPALHQLLLDVLGIVTEIVEKLGPVAPVRCGKWRDFEHL